MFNAIYTAAVPQTLLDVVQQLSNRTARLINCRATTEQSHRTSLCSLRYTVHPEHKKNPERLWVSPGFGKAF
jgi:hypothetical protein